MPYLSKITLSNIQEVFDKVKPVLLYPILKSVGRGASIKSSTLAVSAYNIRIISFIICLTRIYIVLL